MKGKSLWRAAFVLAITSLLLGIIVPPALATEPKQAKGAHSSSGSGNTRHAENNDLTNYRFLPEGYTGYASNWVSVLNLHNQTQTATLQFKGEDGYVWYSYLEDMGAIGTSTCRKAYNINNRVPSGKSVATRVSVPGGRIMAERSTYKGYEGTSSCGFGKAHRGIYLTEGYTGHDVYISVRNCGSTARKFYFSFRTESGPVSPVPTKTIPAYSRGTIRVNDYISGARPVSTVVYAEGNAEVVVAERSSYSGTVATSSSGTWSPWIIGEIWPYMFAEGYSDFQHYISIMNLGGLPGTWQVRFISNAVVRVASTTIPKWARGTIQQTQHSAGVNFASVRDPQTDPPPGSLAQDCTSERSSYYGQWGTSSEGISMLCQRNWFYFSEGFTGHDVYVALYNPMSSTIKMKFIFYVEGVGKRLYEVNVGGGTVAVVHVNNLSWAKSYPNRGYGFEIYSENGLYFAAERSSYFN